MKVDPLICAITICRLSDEFSKTLSRMTKTFLVETPNGCVQCGFPGCFWVSVKPFLPVSLGSHHRDFPLEIQGASRALCPQGPLWHLTRCHAIFFLLCFCVLTPHWYTARKRLGWSCGLGDHRTPLLPFPANTENVAGFTCGELGRGMDLYRILSL